MADLYQQTKLVADKLKNIPEYKNLEKAINEIKKDPQARETFIQFQKAQKEVSNFQKKGTKPSSEKLQKWNQIVRSAQSLEPLRNLSKYEKKLDDILAEVNKTITKPLVDLYHF